MSLARTEDDAPRGFVPMREYLRLQRRVDELEAQLLYLRDDRRDEDCAALVHSVRLATGVTPQGAQMLIALARARTPTLCVEQLGQALGGRSPQHVRIVSWQINNTAMTKHGAPRLIKGYTGSRYGGGGRYITSEGRAWLSERIPELFDKGAAR